MHDGRDRHYDRADCSERLAVRRRDTQLPGECGMNGARICRCARIRSHQFEHRRQLPSAADVGDDERRPAVVFGVHDHCRCAENAIEPGFRSADFTDVLQRYFVGAAVRFADQPEIGQVVAVAGESCVKPIGTAAPQQPFPWQRSVHDLLKLTFGTCFASAGAWNSGYSLNPKTFAVMFAGNWRRSVLYFCTDSL